MTKEYRLSKMYDNTKTLIRINYPLMINCRAKPCVEDMNVIYRHRKIFDNAKRAVDEAVTTTRLRDMNQQYVGSRYTYINL